MNLFGNKSITNMATGTGIIAALLIALNINQFVLAYVFFLISAVLWSIFSIRDGNKQLLLMNVVFGIINMIGLIRFS